MGRFLLPDDIDETAIEAAIDQGRSLVLARPEELTVTYLDTFDWRLFNAGMALAEERGRRRNLIFLEPGCEPLVVPTTSTPTIAADLPEGHIADTAAPLLDIRALIPVGHAHVERRDGRIDDETGNMVTRLRLERIDLQRVSDPFDVPPFTALGIDAAETLQRLLGDDGVEPLAVHDLQAAASAAGFSPGHYSSKLAITLDGSQPAAESVRCILSALLDTVSANVEGVIADIDSEFLHDFRVACRRTRSALTQLKGAFDSRTVAPFIDEFKWLGDVTGPQRDLDVYLLEMPATRAMLPPGHDADLDPLINLIRTERDQAHREVVRALRSARFGRLTASWRKCIESIVLNQEAPATGTTGELAASRITKAHRRILKKGRRLGGDPPAKSLHSLRIDAKKLRYLLEFFKNLYPEKEVTARVKELKVLQDVLGGFNDMEVQRDRLEVFAGKLHTDESVDAGVMLTLGRLAGTLEQRQEAFRLAFNDAFLEFSNARVCAAYDRLFGPKESR